MKTINNLKVFLNLKSTQIQWLLQAYPSYPLISQLQKFAEIRKNLLVYRLWFNHERPPKLTCSYPWNTFYQEMILRHSNQWKWIPFPQSRQHNTTHSIPAQTKHQFQVPQPSDLASSSINSWHNQVPSRMLPDVQEYCINKDYQVRLSHWYKTTNNISRETVLY